MYKLNKSPRTGEVTSVSYQVGNVLYSIPFDPANTCYQQYLKWISEGNTPLPPDEPTLP